MVGSKEKSVNQKCERLAAAMRLNLRRRKQSQAKKTVPIDSMEEDKK